MKTKLSLVLGLSIIVLLLFAAGSFWYVQKQTLATELATNGLRHARQLFHLGDKERIMLALEPALNSPNKSQQAYANALLGAAYLQSGEVQKGVEILKTLSLNEEAPSRARQQAVYALVRYIFANADVDTAVRYVYTGPRWSEFLMVSGSSATPREVGVANRKAQEWAMSLNPSNPLPQLAYSLASKYSSELALSKTLTTQERLEYERKTFEYLALGDKNYSQLLEALSATSTQATVRTIDVFDVGIALSLKSNTLNNLFVAKVSGVDLPMVQSAFADTVRILEKDPQAKTLMLTALHTRVNFAVVLYLTDAKTYTKEIQETLAPIYGEVSKHAQFTDYLRSYGTDPLLKTSHAAKSFKALATIDPRFKDLLLQVGWGASDLQK